MNIEDLLQAMMGGMGKADARTVEGGLLDLLGGLLGGGKTAGGADPADLLRGLLGGGSGGGGSTFSIAEETGLSPAVVQSALGLVMGKLLGGKRQGTAETLGATFESGIGASASAPGSAGNLDSLLERMRGGADVDAQALNATGLPQELAAKAGIDLPQAMKAIQAILALLTGSKAPTTKRRSTKSTSSTAKSRSTGSASSAAKSGSSKGASSTAKSGSTKSTSSSKSTAKSTTAKSSSGTARKTAKTAEDTKEKPATRTRRSSTSSTEAQSTAERPGTTSRTRKPAASAEEKPTAKPSGTTSRTRKKPTGGSGGTSSGELDNILDGWSVSG